MLALFPKYSFAVFGCLFLPLKWPIRDRLRRRQDSRTRTRGEDEENAVPDVAWLGAQASSPLALLRCKANHSAAAADDVLTAVNS